MIVSYVFHAIIIFSQCCASLDALMDGRSPGMEHDPQTPQLVAGTCVSSQKVSTCVGASSFLILMLTCYFFCAKHFCTESAKKQKNATKTPRKHPAKIRKTPAKTRKRPQIQKTGFLACVYT